MNTYNISLLIDNNFSKNTTVQARNEDDAIRECLKKEFIESKLPILELPNEITIAIKILQDK